MKYLFNFLQGHIKLQQNICSVNWYKMIQLTNYCLGKVDDDVMKCRRYNDIRHTGMRTRNLDFTERTLAVEIESI